MRVPTLGSQSQFTGLGCCLPVATERGWVGDTCRAVAGPALLLTADALRAVGEPLSAVVWELPQRALGGLLPAWDDLVA